uniref:(northern house mosquito) hypothetical protein n=1 Tax=Culex pipiens TaxID=7175 RepID=A0A8D8BWU1_CULPI
MTRFVTRLLLASLLDVSWLEALRTFTASSDVVRTKDSISDVRLVSSWTSLGSSSSGGVSSMRKRVLSCEVSELEELTILGGGGGARRFFLVRVILDRMVPLALKPPSETLSSRASSSSNGLVLLRLVWDTPAVIRRPVVAVAALYRERGVDVTMELCPAPP